MFRWGIAVIVAICAVTFSGGTHDLSFREQMVTVKLESNGRRVVLVSRFEVTAASWRQCVMQNGCTYSPKLPAAAASVPVTGVNWFDVNEYLAWANMRAGGGLRLPTLAEWRELNRTNARAPLPLIFEDPRLAWAATYGQERTPTGPVRAIGSFSTTPEGVSDLDGNVWEWTSTCYKSGYERDGERAFCPAFIAAGEHEAVMSVFVRDPALGGCATGTPPTHIGFRLVADQ